MDGGSGRPVMRELELRERAVSAAAAAVLSAILVNPLDVAKTRLQAQAAGVPYTEPSWNTGGAPHSKLYARCPPPCPHGTLEMALPPPQQPSRVLEYKGTWDVMYKVVRHEGVRRLWRGTNAALIMSVPTVGIYLPVYDVLRDALEIAPDGSRRRTAPFAPLLAGAIARSLACVICAPLELARTRMQAEMLAAEGGSKGMLSTMAEVVASTAAGPGSARRRIGSLWTGVGAQLARDVPFSAICWATLEPARRELLRMAGPDAGIGLVLAANFGAGLVAGSLAAAVTCPLDVAKTRRQIEMDPLKGAQMSTLRTLKDVYRDAGVKGLFTGIGARAARAGPSVAIVVTLYEGVKCYLNAPRARQLGPVEEELIP